MLLSFWNNIFILQWLTCIWRNFGRRESGICTVNNFFSSNNKKCFRLISCPLFLWKCSERSNFEVSKLGISWKYFPFVISFLPAAKGSLSQCNLLWSAVPGKPHLLLIIYKIIIENNPHCVSKRYWIGISKEELPLTSNMSHEELLCVHWITQIKCLQIFSIKWPKLIQEKKLFLKAAS